MRNPNRISLRTFRIVVFIRNAKSSCRISLILLYPKSFGLGMEVPLWETREVSDRVHSGVLLQHARHRYLCALVCYDI